MTTKIFTARTTWYRLPIAAGIIAFLIASGGSAQGYWTARSSAAAALETRTVAFQAEGLAALASSLSPSALTHTGSITLRNAGVESGDATLTIRIPSGASLAGKLPLAVWRVGSATECTDAVTPASPLVGTWAKPPAIATALAAGAEATYCVRTKVDDWTSLVTSTGSAATDVQMTASLIAGGWTATTEAALTHRAGGFFPSAPNFLPAGGSRWYSIASATNATACLTADAGGGVGIAVLSSTCADTARQRWEFLPVQSGNHSVVTIRNQPLFGARLHDGRFDGAQLVSSTSAAEQQWRVRKSSASNVYQLMNTATSMCLAVPQPHATALPTVPCDSPDANLILTRHRLGFGVIGIRIDLDLGQQSIEGTNPRLERLDGGSWVKVASLTQRRNTFEANGTTVPNNRRSQYRIVTNTGDVLWDQIYIKREAGWGIVEEGGFQ